MIPAEQNTEITILEAAKKIFKQKGLDGATVQDIANEAGTTKSMVNYYFRSKEKLFGAVFQHEFQIFFGGLASFLNSDMSLYDKIVNIVELDTNKLSEFPELPVFIVNEVNRNPAIVFSVIETMPVENMLKALTKQINAEARKGIVKKVKAEDLLINIQALTVFPFLAKPLMIKVFKLGEKEYQQKINERKKQVVDIIWNYIKA